MAHEIAVSLLAGSRTMSVPDFFRDAKESGYDGVEMWLVPEGGLTFDVTDAQLDEYRRLAGEYGLEIYSLAIAPPEGRLTGTGEAAEAFLRCAVSGMDIASRLGAKTVLHTTGGLAEGMYYEEAYLNGIANLRRLAPEVEKRELRFALEFVWNGFLFSPLEMRNFLTAVNSPNIGFYFDPGNMAIFQKPEHWVRALGHFVMHVHLKDWKGPARAGAWTPLLQGEIDFPAVMAELHRAGYTGPLVSEVARSLAPWPETAQAMRKIAAM
ncbi:MAG: sugar phosphate isomerase/epimerase [Lentisphaeria bacterium]|nr:sugar phosphate isomerase/epimerase [Lentisphaeria bacterium]